MATGLESKPAHQPYWLALRGTQQMDLAVRFNLAAQAQGLRLLALKGISVAEELYGGMEHRPMADVDLLVVDTYRFEEVGRVARAMGLAETAASDHALVFKEPASGVVLELHISLTSCPGLFSVDTESLWARRKPLLRSALCRLADEDLIVHLAMHTAFQHGFAANEYHYGDFVRALDRFGTNAERIAIRARDFGATSALGAMAMALSRRSAKEGSLPGQIESLRGLCPTALARWIEAQADFPPPANLAALAIVRYRLAPSAWGYIVRALFPKKIPGRTLPRASVLGRISNLARVGLVERTRPGSLPS